MKNKRKLSKFQIIIIAIFVLSVVGVNLWQLHWPEARIRLKDQNLNVLVAKTPYHWHRGLGKRESLEQYDGMLFLYFNHARHKIVMRKMEFPIDIIWLDRGRVVDIAPNVKPEPGRDEERLTVYFPRAEANLVLELKSGWVQEHGLKIGDRMLIIQE